MASPHLRVPRNKCIPHHFVSSGLAILLAGVLATSLITFVPPTNAFMPAVCLKNISATGGSGVCCPVPVGSDLVCGGPKVGSCDLVYVQNDVLPAPEIIIDDRINWPTRFFTKMCQCQGNYFGLACQECWFGWKGPNCDKREVLKRRNIFSFSAKEKAWFVHIVSQMPKTMTELLVLREPDTLHSDPLTNPTWEQADLHYFIGYIHRYTSRATLFGDDLQCAAEGFLDNNHNVVGFVTWHRYLMLYWERELRKIAKELYDWDDFAIPYWDWTDATQCEVCTNDLVGAPGKFVRHDYRLLDEGSPFSKWIEYCTIPNTGDRCYGCHAAYPNFRYLNRNYVKTSFPTTKDLEWTLTKPSFYVHNLKEDLEACEGFHQALEGFCGPPFTNGTSLYMHNRVHNMVTGSFCCAATASNDPLFILHHSQIDRIMQVWMRYYRPRPTEYPNHSMRPGNCRECNLIGWLPLVRHVQMFCDITDLGIDYDNYKFGNYGFDGAEFMRKGEAAFKVLKKHSHKSTKNKQSSPDVESKDDTEESNDDSGSSD